MTGIETALLIGGAALSGISAISQGVAANQAAQFNAKIAERNARLARANAQAEASIVKTQTDRKAGAARAAYGASGVTLEGSPLEVVSQIVADGELDRLTTLYQGNLEAAGFQTTAQVERASGRAALRAGVVNGASSFLLGGAYAYGGSGSQGTAPGIYGQAGRYGSSRIYTGPTGRIGGGL